MYKITIPEGKSYLTDSVQYIRRIGEKTFIKTERSKAEGVNYRGRNYLFADGCHVLEVDTADEFCRLEEENKSLKEQLAATEDALCEIDSVNEERIAAIEDALCEIDMGGMN